MKTFMIEKENEMICAKKHANQQIFFVLLNNKLKSSQRLLCQLCIEELDDQNFQLLNFRKVKDKIQQEQDDLYENFNGLIKSTIEKIDLFKQLIGKLKSNVNKQLDELLGGSDNWINSCTEMGKRSAQFSFMEQLDHFGQSITEKQFQQIRTINQCNYSHYQKINKAFIDNKFVQDLLQCQEVLRGLQKLNQEYDCQLESKSIKIENYGSNDTIEIAQKCPQHQSNFIFVDMTTGVKKEERMKCGYCGQGNSILVKEFNLQWQIYNNKKIANIQQSRSKQVKRLSKVQKILSAHLLTLYQQMIQLIQSINSNILFGESSQYSNLESNRSDIQSDLVVEMAEELSRFENDKPTLDELLFEQNTDAFNSSLQSNFKEMINAFQETHRQISIELTEAIEEQSQIINSRVPDLVNIVQPVGKITYQLTDDKIKQNEYSSAIAFNKDGSLMIAGCEEQIKVWSFQNGELKEQLALLSGHTKSIYCLVFSNKLKWFASGSCDSTIRCWKDQGKNEWISSQPGKVHTDKVLCILLSKNEDYLISCSADKSINIWRVDQGKNELEFEYSLNSHTDCVYEISLNETEDHLVSCSKDKTILVWIKRENNRWEFEQQIAKSVDDYGRRVCFLNDNLIAWQQQDKQGFIFMFQLENGNFKEKSELKIELKQLQDSGTNLFPAIYNKKQQVLIQKHNKYVYIIRKQSDCKFKIQGEPIDCSSDYNYGALTEDGRYLAIWNGETKQFRVYQLKYE